MRAIGAKYILGGMAAVLLVAASLWAQQGFQVTDHPTTFVFGVFEGKTYRTILEPGKPPRWDTTPVTIRYVQLDGSPVPPVDPPPKLTPALEKHKSAVQAATNEITDPNKANVKKALAELYRTVAGLPATDGDQLKQAVTILFDALPEIQNWTPWKKAVDKSLEAFTALDDVKAAMRLTAEVLAS